VARELGNRPATCRKYYIHPAILAAYIEGTLLSLAAEFDQSEAELDHSDSKYNLHPEEQAVLALLEQAI
jgi:DNA topoisomerase-1